MTPIFESALESLGTNGTRETSDDWYEFPAAFWDAARRVPFLGDPVNDGRKVQRTSVVGGRPAESGNPIKFTA